MVSSDERWMHRMRSDRSTGSNTDRSESKLANRIEWELKPWLTHLWESLRRGGWHPPVVLVDDKLVQQGTIPTLAELQAAVHLAFEAKGIVVKGNRNASPQSMEPVEEGVPKGGCRGLDSGL
jgi:hypothetical protein